MLPLKTSLHATIFPSILLSIRSHQQTKALYQRIVQYVEDKVNNDEEFFTIYEGLVEMFTSLLPKEDMSRITIEYSKPASKMRVLISTIAFGMGVGIPDIHHVIHWGPSSNALNYLQVR